MNRLQDYLNTKNSNFAAWTDSGSVALCDLLAQSDVPAIVIDGQHGAPFMHNAADMVRVILQNGAAPIVRVGVGRYEDASLMLDLGALGVIAPMIDTAEDAKEFVKYVKYQPIGERSYGPNQAAQCFGLSSKGYVEKANSSCLAFAMIETKSALNNLSEILAVEGLDGVFVGPSDLDIAISKSVPAEPFSICSIGAIEAIIKETNLSGKISAIYCGDLRQVELANKMGARLIAAGSAGDYLRNGLKPYLDIS